VTVVTLTRKPGNQEQKTTATLGAQRLRQWPGYTVVTQNTTPRQKGRPMRERGLTSKSLLVDNGHVSSWNTEPYFGGTSLEQEVNEGEDEERTKAEQDNLPYQMPVSIAGCPGYVDGTLRYLKHEHWRLGSIGSVSRYVTRTGLHVVQRIEALQVLRQQWREAFLGKDDHALWSFFNQEYHGFGTRDQYKVHLKASMFTRVHSRVCDIAKELGLPKSAIGLACLVAGIAQSNDWVPGKHRERAALGFRDFILYLEHRVEAGPRRG